MQSNQKRLSPVAHSQLLRLSVQWLDEPLLPFRWSRLYFDFHLLRIMPLILILTTFCPLAFKLVLIYLRSFHITFHAQLLIRFILKNQLKMILLVWVLLILVQEIFFKKFLLIFFALLRIKFDLIYAVLNLKQYL